MTEIQKNYRQTQEELVQEDTLRKIAELLSVLSGKQGAEGYEAYVAETRKLSCSVDDHKSVEKLQADEEYAVALRTIKDHRLGFSFSFDLTDRGIEEAFQRSLETGSLMDQQQFSFSGSEPDTIAPDAFFDSGINGISADDRLHTLAIMADNAHLDKRIVKVERPSYEEARVSVAIINSAGVMKRARATRFGISLSVLAREGDNAQMSWDFQGTNRFSHLDPVTVARNCAEQALQTLGGVQLDTGFYDTLFTPLVMSQFLSVLAKSFLADSVVKKTSLLADKLGRRIFPDFISILDDPSLEDGHGSVPFDAEGTPAARRAVVDRGTLQSFLYDRYYAALMGRTAGGSAIRHSMTLPPSVGTTNIVLDSSRVSEQDIKRELSDGPVITELMGLHTVNPVTGDFSLGARGYLLRSGAFSSPLKSITIAGNLFSLFNNIHTAGTDRVLYGNILAPSVIVKGLKIAGAGT